MRLVLTVLFAVSVACLPGSAGAATCPVKIGLIVPLTGPLAPVVSGMLKSAQLAVAQVNEAGGVLACPVELAVRDSQAQPSLAVDAAHQLIDLEGIRVIVGEVTSGGTAAVLSAATIPAKVALISPTASSPAFSAIGGQTGLFYRTNVSDALQGVAAASAAIHAHSGTIAVLAINNDWGQNLSKVFQATYEKLGGKVSRIVLYNPDQPSYRAEISSAMQGLPDTLYLIGYTTEGARLTRDWISQGGTRRLLFPHNLNDAAFVKAVGANYLGDAAWLTPGTVDTPSLERFRNDYTAMFHASAEGPGRTSTYDAVVLSALAIESARSSSDGVAIAAGFRHVTEVDTPFTYAGAEGVKQALTAVRAGRAIDYIGATGPLHFDQNGDIAVPFVTWKLDDKGELAITGRMTIDEVEELRRGLDAK